MLKLKFHYFNCVFPPYLSNPGPTNHSLTQQKIFLLNRIEQTILRGFLLSNSSVINNNLVQGPAWVKFQVQQIFLDFSKPFLPNRHSRSEKGPKCLPVWPLK